MCNLDKSLYDMVYWEVFRAHGMGLVLDDFKVFSYPIPFMIL